ncbi:hypothetical protein DL240_08860 [Lujinxingia litoralis]|uniref:Uncharacterized protein n=1 Tax=Lujinxingia litoralis TaxID=2211119 RepID=A0A328C8J5_9DELT|nr:hypothetical protein DL240_08860 [Lujinxingia litoralis]
MDNASTCAKIKRVWEADCSHTNILPDPITEIDLNRERYNLCTLALLFIALTCRHLDQPGVTVIKLSINENCDILFANRNILTQCRHLKIQLNNIIVDVKRLTKYGNISPRLVQRFIKIVIRGQ